MPIDACGPPRRAERFTSVRPIHPYLRPMASCTRRVPSLSRSVAVASTAAPVALPRIVHGATVTRPERRMRFTLPVSRGVQIRMAPPSGAAHTGVGTAEPSRLKVVVAMAVYLARQAWPYLALGVLGVTIVVPEALSDWTGGSLGVVGGVLVTGVTLLLASFAGYRLRSETAAD